MKPEDRPDLRMERLVLGGCLAGDVVLLDEVAQRLRPEDLIDPRHAEAFGWMLAEHAAGRTVDSLSLGLWATPKGGAAVEYLTALADNQTVSTAVVSHADELSVLAYRRRLLKVSQYIARRAQEEDPERLTTHAHRLLDEAAGGRRQAEMGTTSIAEVMELHREVVTERTEALSSGKAPGYSTGFRALDAHLRLRRKELVLVAGRPSMGKSQFVLQMLTGLAEQAAAEGPDGVVLLFSLEMGKEELADRLVSAVSGVPYMRIRDGKRVGVGHYLPMTADEQQRVEAARQHLEVLPIELDDSPGRSLNQIRQTCLRWSRRRDVVAFGLDYLQLVPSDSSEREDVRLTEIANGMKRLAKDIDAIGVAAAQLNRGPEQRADARPKMADLKGSGGLEMAANTLLGLFRDDYQNPASQHPNTAEVSVIKARNAKAGAMARLGFRGGCFVDLQVASTPASTDAYGEDGW